MQSDSITKTTSVSTLSGSFTPTPRQQRAASLAARGHVFYRDGWWQVLSESTGLPRKVDPDRGRCDCPDNARGNLCAHILAVRAVRRANERVGYALNAGTLDDLERRVREKPHSSQFELDSQTILRRAIRSVREKLAEGSWSTESDDDPCNCGPANHCGYHEMVIDRANREREERERARPATYPRRTPGRWKA